jgi:hypothetical protein
MPDGLNGTKGTKHTTQMMQSYVVFAHFPGFREVGDVFRSGSTWR